MTTDRIIKTQLSAAVWAFSMKMFEKLQSMVIRFRKEEKEQKTVFAGRSMNENDL